MSDSSKPADPHILIISDGEQQNEFKLTGGPLDDSAVHHAIMAHIGVDC